MAAGKKITLLLAVLAIACMASRYLICIAGAELKISAACLMSLADSTSARAAMTLDSPILLDCAAMDRGVLEVIAEDDVLDEHGLDLNTPARSDLFDNLSDGLSNLLTTLNHVLEDTSTHNVTEGGLGTFDQGLTDVGDTEGSLVRRCDVVVDDRGQVECDIVLGHADLTGNLDDLNLDIDLDESLGQRVDLDQTRVNGARELAELGDQADVSLRDRLVGVRADDTAGNGAHETNAVSERVDCASVSPAARQTTQQSTYS